VLNVNVKMFNDAVYVARRGGESFCVKCETIVTLNRIVKTVSWTFLYPLLGPSVA